ncbi:MAG: hypothetical protein ABI853_01170 [Sphingomicrobium sp.]
MGIGLQQGGAERDGRDRQRELAAVELAAVPHDAGLEAVELGESRADFARLEFDVAGGLFHHDLLRLRDKPGLELPVAADALGACKNSKRR